MGSLDTIGKRLKHLREKRGLKQNYVAKKVGIAPSTLAGYEKDFREPDIETLKSLVAACGDDADFQWIISGDEEKGVSEDRGSKEERKQRLDNLIEGIKNDEYVNDNGNPISEDLKIAIISILNAAKNK